MILHSSAFTPALSVPIAPSQYILPTRHLSIHIVCVFYLARMITYYAYDGSTFHSPSCIPSSSNTVDSEPFFKNEVPLKLTCFFLSLSTCFESLVSSD
mmetsp:Transcript_7433/g.27811  ORF Transcript_7433/g.27811 Transcript_7433/m.27811 type:complete len:98 (-) Transcript_7433:1517-1810(-)